MNCLYISEEDVKKSETLKKEHLFCALNEFLIEYGKNEYIYSDKVSHIIDEKTQSRINYMICTDLKRKISAVKSVSVFPENPYKFNKKNLQSYLILSNADNGDLMSFIDYRYATIVRTAAINVLAARVLAPSNPHSIAVVGTGNLGRAAAEMFLMEFTTVDSCYIVSKNCESEERLKVYLQNKFNGVDFITCNNRIKDATENAEILISATSAQAPLIKEAEINKCALYCHMAGYEDEYSVARKASKIICDSWRDVKHRSQTISRMYKEGILNDSDIYGDLWEVLSGIKKGREDNDQLIYFNSVGLPYVDMEIAYKIYLEYCV